MQIIQIPLFTDAMQIMLYNQFTGIGEETQTNISMMINNRPFFKSTMCSVQHLINIMQG